MRKIKLGIKGMHCKSCEELMKDVISEISGVANVDVSLKTETATIEFDETKTNEKAIAKAIEKEGYTVK